MSFARSVLMAFGQRAVRRVKRNNIEPDQIIGTAADPYMRRWFLIPKNRFFGVYLHHFVRSDDDRALHDHPWNSLSILLRGECTEWTFAVPEIGAGGGFMRRKLKQGALTYRPAELAHRIELPENFPAAHRPALLDVGQKYRRGMVEHEAWTLFLTGRWVRHWGFHCPQGWVHWQIFTHPDNPGEIGRGGG